MGLPAPELGADLPCTAGPLFESAQPGLPPAAGEQLGPVGPAGLGEIGGSGVNGERGPGLRGKLAGGLFGSSGISEKFGVFGGFGGNRPTSSSKLELMDSLGFNCAGEALG